MVKIGSGLMKLTRKDEKKMVKLIYENEIIYVYFISDETAIKIGKSDNPLTRLSSLQTGNPRELKLLGSSPLLEESDVHLKFNEYRIRGEWFTCEPEIIQFCEDNKTKHFELSQKSKKELIQIILGDEN